MQNSKVLQCLEDLTLNLGIEIVNERLRKGIIDIILYPQKAEVYVDSVNTGKRSNCILELPEGEYQIALFLLRINYRHTFTSEIRYGHLERKEVSLRSDLTVKSFWKKKSG